MSIMDGDYVDKKRKGDECDDIRQRLSSILEWAKDKEESDSLSDKDRNFLIKKATPTDFSNQRYL